MALEVENVTVRRGGVRVIGGVGFTVRPGEAALLRGPNGAGKSSLLRALAGLAPFSGRAEFAGAALDDQVAYAGHLDAVKPVFTVRANLTYWAKILGGDPGAVAPALDHFALSHIADAPAGYCSAGQKRRLGLARLLVAERPVWLLDEPTVSLDAASAAAFADAVARHCAGGGVAVAATHIDLGLPAGPVITLSAPVAETAAADDPFLGEAWA